MSLAEQMKVYEQALLQQVTALDVPVTEIALFKLLADATPEALESIQNDFVKNSAAGEGLKRVCWGLSSDDPRTIVLIFDWRKIQDHWSFWQTPQFEPVMACINKWFEPGRPLVRHYLFDPPGTIDREYTRIFLWDNAEQTRSEEIVDKVSRNNKQENLKAGFAVDPGETTWCCVMKGYDSEEEARADEFNSVQETHLFKLNFWN